MLVVCRWLYCLATRKFCRREEEEEEEEEESVVDKCTIPVNPRLEALKACLALLMGEREEGGKGEVCAAGLKLALKCQSVLETLRPATG